MDKVPDVMNVFHNNVQTFANIIEKTDGDIRTIVLSKQNT